jgi:hypothetical protein
MDPKWAWPEYFTKPGDDEAFPSTRADMSNFAWERPTPESAMADLDLMMRGARISVRDTSAPPSAPPDIAVPPPPREGPVLLRPGQRHQRQLPEDASSLEWGG